MERKDGFYTQTAYTDGGVMSAAMEDYLEMICRTAKRGGAVRVRDLAASLHVRPSSVTHMVRGLVAAGYVTAERYGYITPTEEGRVAGDYLLWRHDVLHRFLCALHGTADELESAEKIEHYLDRRTVERLALLTKKMTGE